MVTGKESADQCGRRERHRFDPWIGKIPWSRKWQKSILGASLHICMQSICFWIRKGEITLTFSEGIAGKFFPRPESLFGRNSFQKFHSLDPGVFLHLKHTLVKIHKPMVLSMYNRVNNHTSEKFPKHCSMENSTEMEKKTVAQNACEAPNPVSFFWKLAVYKNLLNNLDGLPQWPSSKESTCNAGVSGDASSIPGSGRPPGKGNGNPLQYSCLNPMARGDWRAISPCGHKELDTTEAT